MPYDVQQHIKMSQPQPDELLTNGEPGCLDGKERIALDHSETSLVRTESGTKFARSARARTWAGSIGSRSG